MQRLNVNSEVSLSMKKVILIFVFGLLVAGCATVSHHESQSAYGGVVSNHGSYMGLSHDEVQRRATRQCQTYNPSSVARLSLRYEGGVMKFGEAGEYDLWNYKCISQTAIQAEQQEENKVNLASMIDRAKDTCKSLGFTEGTEKFSDCSLKLYTQSVELAAEKNQQVVMQPQSSGSNVMTIYDPRRDSRILINQGQRMLSGRCTLGIDC